MPRSPVTSLRVRCGCGKEGEKIHFWPSDGLLFKVGGKKATGNPHRIVPSGPEALWGLCGGTPG